MANTALSGLGRIPPDGNFYNNRLYQSIRRGIGPFNRAKSTTLIKSAFGVVEGFFVLVAFTLLGGAFMNNFFGTLSGTDIVVFPGGACMVFLGGYGVLQCLKWVKWFSTNLIRGAQQFLLMSFFVTLLLGAANFIHSLDFGWQTGIMLSMIAAISLLSQQTNPSKRWILYMVRGAAAAILSNYQNILTAGLGLVVLIVAVLDIFDATARPYIVQHIALYTSVLATMFLWIAFWCTRKSNQKSLFASYQRYLKTLVSSPITTNAKFEDRAKLNSWFPICVANISILHNGAYQHAAISPVGIEMPNAATYRWTDVQGEQLRTYRGAMTLSGAAIDVGITKSRVFRYLLTTFGVNTGLWLQVKGPTLSTDGPLRIHDLLLTFDDELSTDRTAYARASDGGHFENTGIYYLLKLKLKTIFSFDASFDPAESGEALRMLTFKARRELNTEIRLVRETDGVQEFEIIYPDKQTGKLFYTKHSRVPLPSKNWSKDVSADFPHDSTANQFLSPDLFDSYYELGLYAARNTSQFFPAHQV